MKANYSLTLLILTLILLILIVRLEMIYLNSPISVLTTSKPINNGFALEPQTPINIDDPPFYSTPLPPNEVPIQEVIEQGEDIPVEFIYNNPNWERQAYKEYWHSKYGRWSYVPNRIHYAMHRIFSTYVTASIYYDFVHDLGIAEEVNDFVHYQSTTPYDHIQIVVMNTLVDKIMTFENQIVIIGKPQRTGLQALIIPTKLIQPIENNDDLLIQLVTPDGYEIDHTTEVLARDQQ